MAGINAGPSQGFWSRIGQNLPGALNMAGSMMPGPFGNTAKITGSLMRKPNDKKGTMGGDNTAGVPSNGPSGMAPETGIVRGPSMPRIFSGGVLGPGGMPRNGNTGITGGMFGNLFRPQPAPMSDVPTLGGNGLWNAYNQLSNEIGVPNRQLFY